MAAAPCRRVASVFAYVSSIVTPVFVFRRGYGLAVFDMDSRLMPYNRPARRESGVAMLGGG